MKNLVFAETNLNPTGERKTSAVYTAVNAVAIATGIAWQEAVKRLIEQAHIRSYMPHHPTCITDMMRSYGFKKITAAEFDRDFSEGVSDTGEIKKYIIKIRCEEYLAVVPNEDGSHTVKGIKGFNPLFLQGLIEEIWEFYPGTDNRTGIYREVSERSMPEDQKNLHSENINPKGRFIGDCSVRALGAAYPDCSWDEAMDHLAQASDYCTPFLNTFSNINLALIKLGFERHNPIKMNNKRLTGKEFCELMTHTCFKGERIFAYVGSGHCAAILPVKQEDGSCVYSIQDTWDCTSRKIGEYWTYIKEESVDRPTLTFNKLKIGEKIEHPQFGEGIIVKINSFGNSNILDVEFNGYGIKKISETWLQKNKSG